MKKNIALVSLGCDKNRVDSERALYNILDSGFSLVDDYASADVIMVNTCAFIESARKEAIDTILEMAEYKSTGKCKKLIVTGCLPQKHINEIKDELPEVDAFFGVKDYDSIGREVIELFDKDGQIVKVERQDGGTKTKRILTTPQHYAFLRIADGCNNKCSYCTIPSIRGGYVSEPFERVIEEAKGLVNSGVKELILVAQDVTRYGQDLYGEMRLVPLLKELSKLEVQWIRLMYCYPELVTDELLEEIAQNHKIAKYIDIPLQHVSDKILKAMNRRTTLLSSKDLMEKIKKKGKNIAVRTTFMVGFPGETEDDFSALCDFVALYKPAHIGVFAFSKEDGTAAAKLKGAVSSKVKQERVNKLGKLHLENCRERNETIVGKEVEVLYEEIDFDKNMFVGRMEYDAPDIDTKVYFTGDFADVGNMYKVKITGYEDYDLLGEMVLIS